jgi:hypothetical protein
MATRIYLPSSGTPPFSPAFNSLWQVTTGATRVLATRFPSRNGTATTGAVSNTGTLTVAPGGLGRLVRQYILNEPLASQFIPANGTPGASKVQVVCLESSASANYKLQWCTRWMRRDGTVFESLPMNNIGAGATELATTLTNRSITTGNQGGPGSGANITAVNQWRLIIEIGIVAITSTVSASATLNFGDGPLTDLPIDETDTSTSKAPWVEFLYDYKFSSGDPGFLHND